jgi:hypothetical protein
MACLPFSTLGRTATRPCRGRARSARMAPVAPPNRAACYSRVQYQPWAAQARRQSFTPGWKSKASIRARCASTAHITDRVRDAAKRGPNIARR